jgi:hypothetical protein
LQDQARAFPLRTTALHSIGRILKATLLELLNKMHDLSRAPPCRTGHNRPQLLLNTIASQDETSLQPFGIFNGFSGPDCPLQLQACG